MRKIIYFFVAAVFCFSCSHADIDYQNALMNEALLEEMENEFDRIEEAGTMTSELEAELDEKWNIQFEETKEAYAVYFKNHINTPEGEELFSTSRWTRRLNAKQLEQVLNKSGKAFKTTELYQKSSERLYNMKTAQPGNIYKDILSKDPQGNEIALSEYVGKGKYVLLDFWASWCPPCRDEMPNLVKLYDEYKDKNFEIVGYSLDKTKEDWQSGIEKLTITWPQMSDCEYWDSPGVKLYAVQSIPCTFLIDPEGKIIEKGLVGDKLLDKIKLLVK